MKKSKTAGIISVAFLGLLLLVAGIWLKRKTVAPAMTFSTVPLMTVDDNRLISLKDFTGNVVIVSCFQTWCRDCARETPVLNQLATNLKGERFKVIYITDEGATRLPRFRAQLPSGEILFTTTKTRLADLGIHVYPTTFLLNKNGKSVVAKLEGYNWLLQEAKIKQLLRD